MTNETTEPQQMGLDLGTDAGAQPGQAQGHRRRRRRRSKGKAGATAANGANGQPAPSQNAAPQAAAAPAQNQNGQQQKQQQGQNGNGGRRKKKFFKDRPDRQDRQDRQPNFQAGPGNSVHGGNGGGKKKSRQQKQPRQFVGPMDHSYRVANGNVADSPASTIQMNGNGHASYSSVDLYEPVVPAPAIDANAATRIFCFIEDLFFLAKIQETARKLGVKVEFLKGADKDAVAKLTDAPEEERATLVVFDLNNANAKPLTLIPKLKTKLKRGTSIIGFLSHLQGDLKLKAIEAGCDTVMPRSAFSQSLPNLLRRYGIAEEEEDFPQPA